MADQLSDNTPPSTLDINLPNVGGQATPAPQTFDQFKNSIVNLGGPEVKVPSIPGIGGNPGADDKPKLTALQQSLLNAQGADSSKYAYDASELNSRYKYVLPGVDNEYLHHEGQTSMDRIGNAAVNLVAKTAGYLTQTAGFIVGAPAALATWNVSNLTDNFLVKAGTAITKEVEDTNPIYKGKTYTEGNIWQKLNTTDWWLSDGIDRAALTVATIVPGFAETRGLGLFGTLAADAAEVGSDIKATGVATKLIESAMANPQEFGTMGKLFSKGLYKAAAMGGVTADVATTNLMRSLNAAELFGMGVVGQSGLNAKEAQESVKQSLIDQRVQGLNDFTDDQIEERASQAAVKGFWYTAPLSFINELIELPMLFSSVRNVKNSLLNKVFDPKTGEVLANALEKQAPKWYNVAIKAVGTGFEHGQNESMQVAIGRTLDSEYGAKKDSRGRIIAGTGLGETGEVSSILQNFVDNINDPNGQNNIALGTIQGILTALVGYGKDVKTGRYTKELAQRQNVYNQITAAKLDRRYYETDFAQRDGNGKMITDARGNVQFDQQKLADAGISLAGVTKNVQEMYNALQEGNHTKVQQLQNQSLTGFAYNFLNDTNGVEHLSNILKVKADQLGKDADRANDISSLGHELTTSELYNKQIQNIQNLKKIYTNLDSDRLTMSDLGEYDKKYDNVKRAYLEDVKFTKYKNTSNQIFLQNKIAENSLEAISLGVTQPLTSIDNAQQMRGNFLLNENTKLEKELQDEIEKYKKLANPEEHKEGFENYFKDYIGYQDGIKEDAETEDILSEEEETPIVPDSPFNFNNKGGETETAQEGREYQLPESAKAKVDKVEDEDKYQVTSPNGDVTFHDTKEAAQSAADEINKTSADLAKVKVIKNNADGTIKVEDINGNTQTIIPSQLEGYERIQTDQEKLQKFAEDVNKEQAEIEVNSGVVATVDSSANLNLFEGKLKDVSALFESTTSEAEDENFVPKPHQARAISFLNNVGGFPNRARMKAILVTPNQENALGLGGLAKMQYGKPLSEVADATNIDTGLVAAVYVEQDGNNVYYVDKDGKRVAKVGETMDMNKVVFNTMPTTDLYYKFKDKNGNPVLKFRAEQEAEARAKQAGWKAKREELFNTSKYKVYDFSVSNGIAQTVDNKRNSIGKTLVPSDIISTQEGLVKISTTGFVFHKGKQVKVNVGYPLIQYNDTLQTVKGRTFTPKESQGVFEVLKKISSEVNEQLANNKPIKINRLLANYLQNVLYWRSKGANSANQIFINTNTMNIELGNQKYDLTKIADSEKDIVKQLKGIYQNINNDTLSKKFHDKFLEPHIGPDGNLIVSSWTNYQTYLLADTYPNGSPRSISETPLSTNVAEKSDVAPYNFKHRYSVLEGLELPEQVVKPVEAAPIVETTEGYKLDGITENTFDLSAGPVLFTATQDATGATFVKVNDNQTVIDIANDKGKLGQIIDALKANDNFDASKSDIELVKDFLKLRIAADIQTKAETPVVVEKTPEVPKTDVKTDFSKSKPPKDSEYRMLGQENVDKISDAELDLFREWHAKNVPNIPFEILDRIITTHDNEKAWGVFENGVAKFYRGAERGTEYHEIFEGIWKGFLSEEQKQAVLDEFKSKTGKFKDRESGKMFFYEEATDKQAKERIADDFADFRLGKLPARNIGEKILNFFRNIINFVKQFVSKPSRKEELFKAIDTGRFEEAKLSERAKLGTSEYRAAEGLTQKQTNEVVQDMTARFFAKVFGTNRSLYDIANLTAPEIFDAIKADYIEEDKVVGDKTWSDVVAKTKEYLRTFKIEFDEDNLLNINGENVNNKLYAPEPFSTDWKKNSSFAVKLLTGTLIQTTPTNQQNSSTLSLPKADATREGFLKLLNFSRSFATVMDKLANTTKVTGMVDKLTDLAKGDSNYVRLFTRLKGDREGMFIDFSKFEPHDWRLFVQFYQTFTKQKPDALVQYIDQEGKVYTAPANQFTVIKQTKGDWINNLKALATDPTSLIKYSKTKNTFKTVDASQIPITTPLQMTTFLNRMGITFGLDSYLKLSPEDKTKFADAVASIHKFFGKETELGSITGKTLDIDGQLNTLSKLYVNVEHPSQESTFANVQGDKRQSFSENNAPSLFENEFNEAESVDELKSSRPELNDVFSTNSTIWNRFFNATGKRIKSMKVSYIDGTKNQIDDVNTSTTGLTLGNRFTQELNQNFNGNYNILIPADSSTEWMLNLGNHISYEEIDGGIGWNTIYSTFKGYLKDEIALAQSNRSYLDNTKPRAKELRFFKDILTGKTLSEVNNLIINNATEEEINKYIDDYISDINTDVKAFINNNAEATIKALKDNKKIVDNPNGTFKYESLDSEFATREKLNKSSLSEDQVKNLMTFARTNYIINNIEMHKVIFGDPYQFAIKNGNLDETKRIKSFLSPRRTSFDSPEFNSFHNQQYNKVGEIELKSGDPGYHLFKPFVNTVTFTDVKLADGTNEADAASFIMDNTWREVKMRNGQWDYKNAEDWHQWQMAYTRQALDKREDVKWNYDKNDKLKAQDEKTLESPEPEYVTDVLKPIVTGNKYGKDQFDQVLDKFSQMPLYYKAIEGTNLADLYVKMFESEVGYGIFESGRKVGAEGTYDLYKDGKLNTEPFNNNVPISWKSYGIQVENSYEKAKAQTRGSQLTKLASVDLFDNGKATSEAANAEYQRNKDILNALHTEAYTQLLNKLGIEDLGDGYQVLDKKAVSETLEQEMLRREVDDNVLDTIRVDEDGEWIIPFEASPAYEQIRNILYSIVDKSLVSPKMNGGAKVQVPSTLWESGDRDAKQANPVLKFYTKEQPYMEVMVPHWFKDQFKKAGFKSEEALLEYLNKPENESILKGIGFRIPTQALSSVEVFKIKGFLPQSMGDTVVVPSEITSKAGSDFDIDKLNMYLKNTYIDSKGKLKEVPFFGYGDEAKEAIKKFILKEDLESIFDINERTVEATEDDYGKLADKLYKQSLENAYYDSLEKLITLPENYERLVNPIGDAGLETLSKELDKLKGVDETKLKNRMLDGNYLTSLRHAFVIAKKWVGIGAVNVTNQSLTQKGEVYIDPVKIVGLSSYEKKIIGNGQIALPHNKVTIDGKERISISGVKDKAGKYISDNLSGFITSFVDVAKNPYILKIIGSNNVVSTAMFLTRIGTPLKTTALFLNQPIVREYLNYLDSIDSKSVYSKKNLDAIRSKFPADRTKTSNSKIELKNLVSNIQNYYAGKDIDNAEQQKILAEFLKYHKMAQYLFKLTQSTNYDTTKFRSAEAMGKKRMRTETAEESNIFTSAKDILDKSFIGKQSDLTEASMNAMGSILKLDQLDYSVITNKVLNKYAENEYMAADDFDKIAVKIKSSFVDYIVQNKTNLNDRLYNLLINPDTSVANQLAKAKKDHPEMEILQYLTEASSDRPGGARSIQLKTNSKLAYDNNLYQGMMRELRDNPATNALYNNIVDVAILQGTYQSAISIKNAIPVEDYAARVKSAIDSVASDLTSDNFANGAFERNNWNDENVFKKINILIPNFFNIEEEYTTTIQFDEFPTLEGLSNVGARNVLMLDRFANFFDINSDYISIPRIIYTEKERIDIVDNRVITRAEYNQRKAAGDKSLYDVLGFQKVKYSNGEPLAIGTEVVYKAINLWGDGQYAAEMYTDARQSVFNNGTIKVNNEIPDANIIEYFRPKTEEENVPSQSEKKDIIPEGLPAIEDNNQDNC